MDLEERTVILGFHDDDESKSWKHFLMFSGYDAHEADNLKAMRQIVESEPNAKGYWMDINLGQANSPDPSSCVEIYGLIRERVEAGNAMFLALSGNEQAVQAAIYAGIPKEYVLLKPVWDLKHYVQLLNEVQ